MYIKDNFQQLMVIEPFLNCTGDMKVNVKINDVVLENLLHNPILRGLKEEKFLQLVEGLQQLFEIENEEFLKLYKTGSSSTLVQLIKRKEVAQ